MWHARRSADARPRQLAGATALGLAVALLCGASACRQIVDFDGGHTPGKAGASDAAAASVACGLSHATASCASCVEKRCCSESAACEKVEACKLESNCLQRCGSDPECRAQCGFDAPVSQSDAASALAACLASRCETECGLGCGLSIHDYGNIAPKIASTCHACIVGSVCDAAAACASSTDCDAYRRCVAACSAPDCKQACAVTHAEGAALDPGLAGANGTGVNVGDANGACNADCGLARNWSCVGRAIGSRRQSDTVALTVDFKDGVSQLPFAGLDVSVCHVMDVQCENPIAPSARSNKAGRVEFTLERHEGTTLGLGIDGYVQVTSPDIYPYLSYWGFPLTESRYGFWASAFTVEEFDNLVAAYPELSPRPTLGSLVVSILDCDGISGQRVEVTLEPDPGIAPVYGFTPKQGETDHLGWAYFANVPQGFVSAIATPRDLGHPAAKKTVYVRKGWATGMWLSPNQ
jgi:hypothetical protein